MKNNTPPPPVATAVASKLRQWLSLPVLMHALVAPARAQKGAAPAAAIPPVDNCLPTFSASQSTICQGGSAVIAFGESPCSPSGQVTYAWSPANDISAVTGSRVVVNPLKTTTYTLTRTPASGAPTTYSITITVRANCCQTATVPPATVVQLNNDYVYGYTNPFSGYPSGTIFHVAGNLTLHGTPGLTPDRNVNDIFTMQPGMVLLMDAGASVYVQDGARLELNGSTITAACDEMWGGLYIKGTSDQLDLHGVGVGSTTARMHNRIMHSQHGIVLENQGPEFQINFTDFLHNFASLDIDRQGPRLHTPAPPGIVANKVQYCTFDSDPTLMKAPYQPNGNDYTYTDTHVRVAGDLTGAPSYYTFIFQNNTFDHALFHVRSDRTKTPLRVVNSAFSNFYLAGIYYVGASGPLTSMTGSDVLQVPATTTATGTIPSTCTFTFPDFKNFPATGQLSAATRIYNHFLHYGTTAIKAEGMAVSVAKATFQQPAPIDYAGFAGQTQAGIEADDLTATSNNFEDLTYGIAQDFDGSGSATYSATQNLFEGCGAAYVFSPAGTTTGTATIDCNSFNRVSAKSVNTGQYFGIYVDPQFTATINGTGSGAGNVRKNMFNDGGLGAGAFLAINNASGVPVNYATFNDYVSTLSPLVSANVNFPFTGVTYQGTQGMNCAPTGPNGLPRPVGKATATTKATDKATLVQNAPNPAHDATRITYHLPAGTRQAVLLLHRALDGQRVGSVPLNVGAKSCEVKLDDYPAGTYFYTLLVDGIPAATCRLVVQ